MFVICFLLYNHNKQNIILPTAVTRMKEVVLVTQ